MTDKSFRFRHASELAGSMVLLCTLALIMAVVLAGKAKGWFEGKFTARVLFDKGGGTLGLKEGNEVIVGSTLAGRVGKIVPNDDGQMETTLIIQERFHQFVKADSIAKVRRKFIAAGDAFVEIVEGKGPPIEPGSYIECEKDEEVMDTAKKVLKDVQEVALPVLKEVESILKNVNELLASVNEGAGVAGTIVNDPELAGDVKDAVGNLNALLVESQDTLVETRRLIRGMQRHWLLRKYVKEAKDEDYLSVVTVSGMLSSVLMSRLERGLAEARLAGDKDANGRYAHNLCVAALARGNLKEAQRWFTELELAWKDIASSERKVRLLMLEAEIARRTPDIKRAMELAMKALNTAKESRVDRDLLLESVILAADICVEADNPTEAIELRKIAEKARKKTKNDYLKAGWSANKARILALQGDMANAAKMFDEAAARYQAARVFYGMARSFEAAGDAYGRTGEATLAADRILRAAQSLLEAGQDEKALLALKSGARAVDASKDPVLLAQYRYLAEEMASTRAK